MGQTAQTLARDKNMESINKLNDGPTIRLTHQAILGLHSEQQANRKFMIGGLFLIIAFSAATFGLTLGAAEFSKESKVNGQGLLVSASDSSKPITVQCADSSSLGTDKGSGSGSGSGSGTGSGAPICHIMSDTSHNDNDENGNKL